MKYFILRVSSTKELSFNYFPLITTSRENIRKLLNSLFIFEKDFKIIGSRIIENYDPLNKDHFEFENSFKAKISINIDEDELTIEKASEYYLLDDKRIFDKPASDKINDRSIAYRIKTEMRSYNPNEPLIND